MFFDEWSGFRLMSPEDLKRIRGLMQPQYKVVTPWHASAELVGRLEREINEIMVGGCRANLRGKATECGAVYRCESGALFVKEAQALAACIREVQYVRDCHIGVGVEAVLAEQGGTVTGRIDHKRRDRVSAAQFLSMFGKDVPDGIRMRAVVIDGSGDAIEVDRECFVAIEYDEPVPEAEREEWVAMFRGSEGQACAVKQRLHDLIVFPQAIAANGIATVCCTHAEALGAVQLAAKRGILLRLEKL